MTMTDVQWAPMQTSHLFEGGNFVFLSGSLLFRCLALGVSLYLFIHHVPTFKRWTPSELRKPFRLLSKQQRYRSLNCIFLFMMLVSHTLYLVLEMVLTQVYTQYAYFSNSISNWTNVVGMMYHSSLFATSLFILLAELDRYKRITLVIPGSTRDKILYRISLSIVLLTVFIVLYHWICTFIAFHDENTTPRLMPFSQFQSIRAIRNIVTAVVVVYETLVELYYNTSMVSVVLKEYSSDNGTASLPQKRKIMKLLGAVFAAHLITLLLMALGSSLDYYYPLSFLSISILAFTTYVSFSLTDVLLQCAQEAKHTVLASGFTETEMYSTTEHTQAKSILDSKHESYAKSSWARNIIASFY